MQKSTHSNYEDQLLLWQLRNLADKLGRTPTKGECPFSCILKQRFGTWSRVCEAAGLSKPNEPVQTALRLQCKTQSEQSQ